jgi:pimeloyl-ACP methyl ester carboxylesterase
VARRLLAHDDVGDPAGTPVVYLHGTPDSRLARHPDDRVAARLGVRLVAVDRPGFGDSPPDIGPLAPALADLADDLGLDRFALLGWSSGGLAALGAAAALGDRLSRVVLVATLPPSEAYADPGLVATLGPGRQGLVEMVAELQPAALAGELASYLVPEGLTPDLALEHVREGAGDRGRAELAAVPGAAEAIAAGLLASAARGTGATERDLVAQLSPGTVDLGAVVAPVLSVHGEHDDVSPPAVGEWLVARLPDAAVEVVPGAAHHLLFPHWERLLEAASAR